MRRVPHHEAAEASALRHADAVVAAFVKRHGGGSTDTVLTRRDFVAAREVQASHVGVTAEQLAPGGLTEINHCTPHTRDDGCDPEAALCFLGMAPNGEFLKIRKNRHQRHQRNKPMKIATKGTKRQSRNLGFGV